jgi:hypothetical protein
LLDIEAYCRQRGIAESTFGRRAVNDGKFVARLRDGKRVTTATLERVQSFMGVEPASSDPAELTSTAPVAAPVRSPNQNGAPRGAGFRFYDNRQKYLLFVNTCSEKWVVAERVGMELGQIRPKPPALRVFDAGVGDGTVLARVLRGMHQRFPTLPFYVAGKEISLEDVRLTLEKMSDRFYEHPATVLVITNLYYGEAPRLMPRSLAAAASLNWQEVSLTGTTAHEFDEQIRGLQPLLDEGWQTQLSPTSGKLLYERPSVLILYREDHRFLLDSVIPRPGQTQANYDLVIASQPYRARVSAEAKAKYVLAPLARSLAPGGRLLGIHSYGRDPALDIIRRLWPKENPFQVGRHEVLKSERDLKFNAYSDKRAIFRYEMHTLPSEIGDGIGTSTLFAAWNAAIYVAQIEEERLEKALASPAYLEATREVLQKHGGLWFLDESFVVSRRRP